MTIAETIGGAQNILPFLARVNLSQAALRVMVDLDVADRMSERPIPVAELARSCGANESNLHRILKFLASEGLVTLTADGSVAHNEFSRALQNGHPLMIKEQIMAVHELEAFLMIPQGVRSGEIPFKLRYGKSYFEYFAENPDIAKRFAEYMSLTTRKTEEAIAAHRFRPFKQAIDIGGSHGSLLRRLLKEYPSARGVVYDLPHVAEEAKTLWAGSADAERLDAVGGSFFEAVPAGADLYLLKQILHDWNDEECVQILSNIRRVIAPDARLTVIDIVLPETVEPHEGWMMDMLMMALLGGKERKLSEFKALFQKSGFEIADVTTTSVTMSIMDVVPV